MRRTTASCQRSTSCMSEYCMHRAPSRALRGSKILRDAREARYRGSGVSLKSLRDKLVFKALDDDERLHHRVAEPVTDTTFSESALLEDVDTLAGEPS